VFGSTARAIQAVEAPWGAIQRSLQLQQGVVVHRQLKQHLAQ
jgi:hypothetical protein